MRNNVIVDYRALKNALKSGAEKYIDARKKDEKPSQYYPDIGFFHGKKGMDTATNLLRYTQIMNMDNFSILALAIAIFRSSSSWLATEIAYQLITGNYIKYTYESFGQDAIQTKNRDTLNSNAFNKDAIYKQSVTKHYEARYVPAEDRIVYDKKNSVKSLLFKTYQDEFSVADTSGNVTVDAFESRIQKFEKVLASDPTQSDTDLSLASFSA